MDRLQVHEMVFQGIHGRTGHETHVPQRFRVDVDADVDFSRALTTDRLSDTLDYCIIEQIVRRLVTEESHVLIETLASRIADSILENDRVHSVKVMVSKLDVFGGAEPSVTCARDRTARMLNLKDIDGAQVVDALICRGGASVPLLTEERRVALVDEALTYHYHEQPEYVGRKKLVREQVVSCSELSEDSPFWKLRKDIEALLALRMKNYWHLWETAPFNFTDPVLQRYPVGSIGITPHREGKSVLNAFCVVTLTGEAVTGICDNREGGNPYYLDTTPGTMLIFRGQGFLGSTYQPFHFMTYVKSERITFCLRQRKEGTSWGENMMSGRGGIRP